MTETFSLAPMSSMIRAFTIALLALPGVFLWHPLLTQRLGPPAWIGGLLVLLYVAVWVWWRPARFDIGPTGLLIRFPGRTREISLGHVSGCRTLSGAEFYAEFGYAVRIGVGGLFGGFGWLWSRRLGLVDFYVSRTDGLVLIERRDARPILITPERPDEMVASLSARLTS